jgi:ABC-type glycerol-3-phosphate transport system permease component
MRPILMTSTLRLFTNSARPGIFQQFPWRRSRRLLSRLLMYALITLVALAFLSPFLMMVSVSLKPPSVVYRNPPVWFYWPPEWSNYSRALEAVPQYPRYVLNTVFVSGFNIVATVFSCSLCAYGFARIRWYGRETLFFVLIATMMIPFQVTLIPTFVIFSWLRWVDTLKPLTLPALLGTPFYIFMLRQFFLGIPLDLSDAAKIDGASEWQIFTRIILPLAKPALITTALFVFLSSWNDFLGPLIYIYDDSKKTLALGLFSFMGRWQRIQLGQLMAASVLTILPVLIVFVFAQRFFIQGIKMTGLKE